MCVCAFSDNFFFFLFPLFSNVKVLYMVRYSEPSPNLFLLSLFFFFFVTYTLLGIFFYLFFFFKDFFFVVRLREKSE